MRQPSIRSKACAAKRPYGHFTVAAGGEWLDPYGIAVAVRALNKPRASEWLRFRHAGWFLRPGHQLGEADNRARAKQRLVDALVTGGAIDLRAVAQRPQPGRREDTMQRVQEIVVQVAHHTDAIPGRHALRRALRPVRELPRVVTIGAVDPERLR